MPLPQNLLIGMMRLILLNVTEVQVRVGLVQKQVVMQEVAAEHTPKK